MLKRAFDIFLSSLGLFCFFPLWLLLAFFIFLEDGGPVFYLQDRVGLNGRMFKMFKFRTMGYKNANSRLAGFLRRTALDELPQLLNIFKGDMSFVGPRPLILEEVIGDKSLGARFAVRPGLTGVAQIAISKEAPVSEKSQFDFWYIKNRNFFLDSKLILRSVWISLRRRWDAKIKKV